jgi:hypothetical protein
MKESPKKAFSAREQLLAAGFKLVETTLEFTKTALETALQFIKTGFQFILDGAKLVCNVADESGALGLQGREGVRGACAQFARRVFHAAPVVPNSVGKVADRAHCAVQRVHGHGRYVLDGRRRLLRSGLRVICHPVVVRAVSLTNFRISSFISSGHSTEDFSCKIKII